MSCIDAIRSAINSLPDTAIFTTRDMIRFGFRNNVDQCMSRLVKAKLICRLVRGVFIKAGTGRRSTLEVALVKARSFGRELFSHGETIAKELNILDCDCCDVEENDPKVKDLEPKAIARGQEMSQEDSHSIEVKKLLFHVRGKSSSFAYENKRIYMQGTTERKTHLGDSAAGKLIRALWYVGKKKSDSHLRRVIEALRSDQILAILEHSAWMPAWLSDQIRLVEYCRENGADSAA